jgi:drug/metabolite transporter (DMT)-like permease
MMAFAANSLLSRVAVYSEGMDPSLFALYRTFSGAVMLCVLLQLTNRNALSGLFNKRQWQQKSNWLSGAYLALYMVGFSYSYMTLNAGLGALLLFSTVQLVLLLHAIRSGERLTRIQTFGYVISIAGMTSLVVPTMTVMGATTIGMLCAILAGIGWGHYTLLGKKTTAPLFRTAFAFIVATSFVLIGSLAIGFDSNASDKAVALAVVSGCVTSACAYAAWYALLPKISGFSAALYQLSVPALTFLGAVMWLGEVPTSLELTACVLTLLGIVVTQLPKRQKATQ